ncbi:MAG: WG repeat-containing protein [Bacteroidota bacterium]|jgi:hypothetical protein|nr:WG repeat-containing protein [Bacteroidota bacterium]
MRIESGSVPFARRVNIIILALLLAFQASVLPQEVTSSPVPVYISGKGYGYEDPVTGTVVIKPQFENAYSFHGGLAVVRNKNKSYSIINTRGKSVYPSSESDIKQYTDPEIFTYWDSKKSGRGVLDYNLKMVIPAEYNEITVVGKVIVVKIFGFLNPLNKDISGIYNSSYELVVPVKFDGKFEETEPGYISNTYGTRVGLITTEGKIIIPFDRLAVRIYKEDGLVMAKDTTSAWQAYNLDGSLMSDLKFEEFQPGKSGYFTVRMNGKWGVFKEKLLTQCLYDEVDETDYADGTFILKKENKSGVTDTAGNELVPYKYDVVSRHGKETFLVAERNKYGLYNRSGKSILPCILDSIPPKPENGAIILTDGTGKYGCITVDGTQVVPFVLDEAYVLNNYSVASAYLKKMLEFSPTHPELIYLNALGYCSKLNSEDAFEYLNNILAGYAEKRDAPKGIHYLISKLYTDQGKASEASLAALYAQPSIYGHRAYIYLGDMMFKKENFSYARVYYDYAGIYVNKEVAEAKDRIVVEEMKKRGLFRESTSLTSGQATAENAANLPTTLMGFTKADRMEYAGDYKFKRLFTYEEAVIGTPAGFRLPGIDDWAKLIRYIADDSRIPQGSEYLAVRLMGEGWTSSFTEEGVLKNTTYTVNSKDRYGLGIMPLRKYNNTLEVSEFEQGHNIISYWIEPATYEGSRVNCVEITTSGFSFVYRSASKACVRYVRK